MTEAYSHVYLSPHYDDAALSCGGTIAGQVQAGQPVLVVTVCAAPPEPGEPLSPFAAALHDRWGNPLDMVATRQAEDALSLAALGADYLRLNLADCIYRGRPEAGEWYYQSDMAIFGPIHPADVSLAGTIVAAITELVPRTDELLLYAPLGVGHHVDHQLVRAAAWQLWQGGWPVAFYEDYPYADPHYPFTRPGYPWEPAYNLPAILAAWPAAGLRPQLHPLSADNLQAKFAGVRAYTSQVQDLFGGDAEMERRLRDYAGYVGQGQWAERVWLPA